MLQCRLTQLWLTNVTSITINFTTGSLRCMLQSMSVIRCTHHTVKDNSIIPTGADKPTPAPSSTSAGPSVETSSDVTEKSLIDFGPTTDSSQSIPDVLPKPSPKPRPKPPAVATKPPAPEKPVGTDTPTGQTSTVKVLTMRRDQYKLAARNSNREGDKEQAKKYLLKSKVTWLVGNNTLFLLGYTFFYS